MKRLLSISFAVMMLAACGPETEPETPSTPDVPVLPPPPETDPEPEADPLIRFCGDWNDLFIGESTEASYELYGDGYDSSRQWTVSFSSSDPSVATVSQDGTVSAKGLGCSVISVSINGTQSKAERRYYVVNLSQINQPFSRDAIMVSGHTLYYKSVMQSWDFFDDFFYACQVCGSPHSLSYTRKPVYSQGPQSYMHLKYFGHGDNMFVERTSDGDWLWTSNYGTLEEDSSNRYTDSQVLSRVKFEAGRTMEPSSALDNYVLPGMKRLIAAYDPDNGSIGIWARDASGVAWFQVYDLETIKAAPKEAVSLPYIVTYGTQKTSYKPVVRACNLSKQAPLLKFKMPFNNVPQGYDWHHGKLWFFRGAGAEPEAVAAGTGKNWATAYLINSEGKLQISVKVPWVDNVALLASEGITDLGYFEAEGIKVKDGVLYLGYASKDAGGSPERRINIFKYPLD